MSSEPLQEERRIVSSQTELLTIPEAREHRRQSLPASIRANPDPPLELVIERRPRKVCVKKRCRNRQRQPGSVNRERLAVRPAQSLEIEKTLGLRQLEHARDLGFGHDATIEDLTRLGHARRFDRTEQRVQPAEWLLELRPSHHGPPATLATKNAVAIEGTDRLTNGVSTHFVCSNELCVGRERVNELTVRESTIQVGLELGPQRKWAAPIKRVRSQPAPAYRRFLIRPAQEHWAIRPMCVEPK